MMNPGFPHLQLVASYGCGLSPRGKRLDCLNSHWMDGDTEVQRGQGSCRRGVTCVRMSASPRSDAFFAYLLVALPPEHKPGASGQKRRALLMNGETEVGRPKSASQRLSLPTPTQATELAGSGLCT